MSSSMCMSLVPCKRWVEPDPVAAVRNDGVVEVPLCGPDVAQRGR
jgi:hypothetical protein